MDILYDFIFSFTYTMGLSWYIYILIKTLCYLAFTFVIVYLLDALQMIKVDDRFDFKTNSELVRIRSCVCTLIFVNIFWFLFIKFNGLIRFKWDQFLLDNTNVYISIIPIISSIVFIVYLYNTSLKKLKL